MKTIKFTALLTILLTIPLTILFTQSIWASCGNTLTIQIGKNDVTIKWYESPNKTFNPANDYHFATDHNKKSIGKFKHHSHLVLKLIVHCQVKKNGVY